MDNFADILANPTVQWGLASMSGLVVTTLWASKGAYVPFYGPTIGGRQTPTEPRPLVAPVNDTGYLDQPLANDGAVYISVNTGAVSGTPNVTPQSAESVLVIESIEHSTSTAPDFWEGMAIAGVIFLLILGLWWICIRKPKQPNLAANPETSGINENAANDDDQQVPATVPDNHAVVAAFLADFQKQNRSLEEEEKIMHERISQLETQDAFMDQKLNTFEEALSASSNVLSQEFFDIKEKNQKLEASLEKKNSNIEELEEQKHRLTKASGDKDREFRKLEIKHLKLLDASEAKDQKISELSANSKELSAALNEKNAKILAVSTGSKELSAALEAKRKEQDELSKAKEELLKAVAQQDVKIEGQKDQLQKAQASVENKQQQLNAGSSKIARLEKETTELKTAIESKNAELSKVKGQLINYENDDFGQALKIGNLETAKHHLEAAIKSKDQELAKMKIQNRTAQETGQAKDSEIADLKKFRKDQDSSIGQKDQELIELKTQIQQYHTDVTDMTNKVHNLEKANSDLRDSVKQMNSTLQNSNSQYQSELESIKRQQHSEIEQIKKSHEQELETLQKKADELCQASNAELESLDHDIRAKNSEIQEKTSKIKDLEQKLVEADTQRQQLGSSGVETVFESDPPGEIEQQSEVTPSETKDDEDQMKLDDIQGQTGFDQEDAIEEVEHLPEDEAPLCATSSTSGFNPNAPVFQPASQHQSYANGAPFTPNDGTGVGGVLGDGPRVDMRPDGAIEMQGHDEDGYAQGHDEDGSHTPSTYRPSAPEKKKKKNRHPKSSVRRARKKEREREAREKEEAEAREKEEAQALALAQK